MAPTPGTRLGPYEIAAQIGVGGMGEGSCLTRTPSSRSCAVVAISRREKR